MPDKLTYRDSGVNIDAGNELVRRIASACKATQRSEIFNDVGGFAALAEIPTKYKEPILVTGTDGVGTKLKLAIEYDKHDTIGQDLVAMCVNDVLVTGAEPFLFLDYFATDKLNLDIAERVIKGIANGCTIAGCSLVGGETAEMPGLYRDGDYDLAGFCLGVVEKRSITTGDSIRTGDVLIALESSGPHSNGYSLIRKILENHRSKVKPSIIEDLLMPTRIYADSIQKLLNSIEILGMAHITGGGLTENLPRMLKSNESSILLDMNSWKIPKIFNWLQKNGNIARQEMLRTFNCGVGFVICVSADQAKKTCNLLKSYNEKAWVIGEIASPDALEKETQLLIHGAG